MKQIWKLFKIKDLIMLDDVIVYDISNNPFYCLNLKTFIRWSDAV